MYYAKFFRDDERPLLGSDSYHRLDGRLCLSNLIKQGKNAVDNHINSYLINSFEIRKGNIRKYKTIVKVTYGAREEVGNYIEKNMKRMVDNHLDVWYGRYRGKTREEVKFDLAVNHDPSLEIEKCEENIPDVTNEEVDYIIDRFNEAVVEELKQ